MSGDALTLHIESLASSGDGVAHAPEGRVVFVPFSAPGDRVRVVLTDQRKRFARGRLEQLLEPGPARTEPPCPVFGDCGGCAWQHVDYAAQVSAKRAILRDAFVRIGRLDPTHLPDLDFVASPDAYAYRGRARLLVESGAVGFRRRRSHHVCGIEACALLTPSLARALGTLAADSARSPIDGQTDGEWDGEWELTLGAGGRVRTSRLGDDDAEPIDIVVGGERLSISTGVFVQANALLRESLARTVIDAAGHGRDLLELFAGAGFFTLGLARSFARVVAVEGSAAAVGDLGRNLHRAGLTHVRAVEARAEDLLTDAEPADVVVLDPPRGGIGREGAVLLAALARQRIVYVSCDPATLARDLAVLAERGWQLRAVTGFDLFPQTPHVEAVVVLDRA